MRMPTFRAGTNSYVLFTLDKLIMKVVKQMQMLLNDDLASVRPCRVLQSAHHLLQAICVCDHGIGAACSLQHGKCTQTYRKA